MDIETLRDYCLSKQHVTESFPFDEDTLVFKVAHKMFALVGLHRLPHAVNLKCEPEKATVLRENYNAVTEGYHMSKKHWNTITINSDMNMEEIKLCIDHSYCLVVKSMTKKMQKELGF